MNKRKLNLSIYSVVLAVIPWFYPIFAEFMTRDIAMIAAPLACLSCFSSIVTSLIVIGRKGERGIRFALIALVLNLLLISLNIYSLFVLHN